MIDPPQPERNHPSMFSNIGRRGQLDMAPSHFRAALDRHWARLTNSPDPEAAKINPNLMPAGMVLEARGQVYPGSVDQATVARRRAKNKAAGQARAMHRRAARR